VDPLTVRFTDLHKWVTALPDFADDPAKSSEGKLEAIQMAWLEEYKTASNAAQGFSPPRAVPFIGSGSHSSCILLLMTGGPSHLDTWDMKPGAPSEIRGPFRPICTNVRASRSRRSSRAWRSRRIGTR